MEITTPIEQIPEGTVKNIMDWVTWGDEAEDWKLNSEYESEG